MIGFFEGVIYELVPSIDNLVALDCEDTVGLSQLVKIGRLLDQHIQDVFVDGADFARAAEKWSLLDGFDKRAHRHSVMVLVSDNRRSVDVSA